MTALGTTAELLLQWDRSRPRSKQKELGMSDLGGCRRAAGYRIHQHELGAAQGSVVAVLGTAVHEAVRAELVRMREAGEIPAAAMIETEVHFGGVTGHLDLYVDGKVRDTKTVGHTSQLDRYRSNGPPLRHLWQIHAYGAALILGGHEVDEVQLDYVARDTGETWLWRAPFSTAYVRAAYAWLRNVQETPLEMLARDYTPESAYCRSCPFAAECWQGHATEGRNPLTALFVDDPDAAKWAERLREARVAKHAAEEEEERARGALDALRPNNDAGSRADVEVPGFDLWIRFSVSQPKRLDGDQVREDYRMSEQPVPLKPGKKSVKVELIAPPPGAGQ